MTGVGNLGEKIAIKIINDILNFESSMCDATTQSLSRYCTYPVPVVTNCCTGVGVHDVITCADLYYDR